MKKILQSLVICLLLIMIGCAPQEDTSYKPIRIVYPNWAEGEAMSFLAEIYLEEMGYNVFLKCAPADSIYRSLYFGKQDVFLDAWLPDTHEFYYTMYKDNLENISTVIDQARIGLVVPSYVAIDSIEDLHRTHSIFQGRIIGIEKGAGIMLKTEEAMKAYNLGEYDLISSSERNMTAILSFAIKTRRPIVITGWDYHWKFSRYDLKYLDDPQEIYSKTDSIHIIARKGFSEEFPKQAEALSHFKISSDQFKSLLNSYRLMNTETEKKAAVDKWVDENRDVLEAWKAQIN